MIWVPNGIYQDETNEHIDNMCCFVRPGVVGADPIECIENPAAIVNEVSGLTKIGEAEEGFFEFSGSKIITLNTSGTFTKKSTIKILDSFGTEGTVLLETDVINNFHFKDLKIFIC